MFIKILFCLLVISTSAFSFKLSPSWERNTGDWTSEVVAEPDLADLPAQYFGCGVRIREMIWTRTWQECRHIFVWKRCSTKTSSETSKTNAIQFTFCHQDNPIKKIIRTLESTPQNSGNWRDAQMCPFGYLISGIAPQFDTAYG